MARRPDLGHEARLLGMLEGLLALDVVTLDHAMQRAAELLADALGADAADVLLHYPESDALVALGTSHTTSGRGRAEQELLPLADLGPVVEAFRTGETFLTGRLDLHPHGPRRIAAGFAARSVLAVPIEAAGERRGVLVVATASPDAFTAEDRAFAEAVAEWVGLAGYRALYLQHVAERAAEEGLLAGSATSVDLLTSRQQEVAVLVAEGLSNIEIARRLVLQPGTVANHIEHILRRLDLQGRVRIAMWTVQQGLYRPDGEGGDPSE